MVVNAQIGVPKQKDFGTYSLGVKSIIPAPIKINATNGECVFKGVPKIEADASFSRAKSILVSNFANFFTNQEVNKDSVVIKILKVKAIAGLKKTESYLLSVSKKEILIKTRSEQGAICGAWSLLQLFPPEIHNESLSFASKIAIPCIDIEDEPEFEFRGLMLDVARHYFSKADVKKFIKTMALYKFNTLHWHLTEDQGWRIEIEQYPLLTKVGAYRKETQVGTNNKIFDKTPHGGYYSKQDIAQIVDYAYGLGVIIIPEIDLPGHSISAIAAYPELGIDWADGKKDTRLEVGTRWGIEDDVLNVETSTINFYKTVLDEVCSMFWSARYISLGGDECPKIKWKQSPRVNERMKELKIKKGDYNALQAWFMGQLFKHLEKKGYGVLCWDEIADGPKIDRAIIDVWRGSDKIITCLEKGYDIVACPSDRYYLDWQQTARQDEPYPIRQELSLETVFLNDVRTGIPQKFHKNIIGVQANVWTEFMNTSQRMEDMTFPRALAVADYSWNGHNFCCEKSEKEVKKISYCSNNPQIKFAEFKIKLEKSHFERLNMLGIRYRKLDGIPDKDLLRPSYIPV